LSTICPKNQHPRSWRRTNSAEKCLHRVGIARTRKRRRVYRLALPGPDPAAGAGVRGRGQVCQDGGQVDPGKPMLPVAEPAGWARDQLPGRARGRGGGRRAGDQAQGRRRAWRAFRPGQHRPALFAGIDPAPGTHTAPRAWKARQRGSEAARRQPRRARLPRSTAASGRRPGSPQGKRWSCAAMTEISRSRRFIRPSAGFGLQARLVRLRTHRPRTRSPRRPRSPSRQDPSRPSAIAPPASW